MRVVANRNKWLAWFRHPRRGLTLVECQPSGLRLRVSEQRRDDTPRERYLKPDVRQGFQSTWAKEAASHDCHQRRSAIVTPHRHCLGSSH